MNDILKKIRDGIAPKLEEKKRAIPFSQMLEIASATPSRASFKFALKSGGENPAVIAELKKASPSAGVIRANFLPLSLAASLEAAGAAALSVLTEENYFLGSPEILRDAAKTAKIPLLRKDFIFDEYQIAEARALGASAVLLIAKMLDTSRFAELLEFAKSLKLDVLAEAHDQNEIESVLEAGADIVGVNCRNLSNFDTDLSISESLLKTLPDTVVKVSESAITDRTALLRARDAGADAALIGTALMSAPEPDIELKKLLGTL